MILGVTTSTPRCTVALFDSGRVLASHGYDDEKMHAERIFGALDTLVASAKRPRRDIRLVACDVGPGSFTGVRVGVASAQGIAMGLGAPMVGVGSLEAMVRAAHALTDEPHEVIGAMLDAKRGETFIAAYTASGDERLAPRHVAAAEAAAALADVDACCGARADDVWKATLIAHPHCALPHAEWIARIAAERPPTDTIEPIYVRAPDATPQF